MSMPPSPILAMTWYGPRVVPGWRGMGKVSVAFYGIQADHGLISDDLGAVNRASGNRDRVSGLEYHVLALEKDPKPSGDDGVYLIHVVRVIRKRGARRIGIPGHHVAALFQSPPQHRLADRSIPVLIPTLEARGQADTFSRILTG